MNNKCARIIKLFAFIPANRPAVFTFMYKIKENEIQYEKQYEIKVVRSRKLDLRHKQMILLSRIVILLLLLLHENNFKHRKIILLINFIFDPTFCLIASYQILKNYAILISQGSFFQEKYFLQLDRFRFLKMNSLMAEIIKKQFFKTTFL